MARRSYGPEQIINKLREAEVLLSQGSTVSEATRKIESKRETYYRLAERVQPSKTHSALNYRPPAPEAIIPLTLT